MELEKFCRKLIIIEKYLNDLRKLSFNGFHIIYSTKKKGKKRKKAI